MRKTAVFFLLFAAFSANLSAAQRETPRNMILIGWDGAQRNHIKECLERKELPNLMQLASEGAIAAIDVLRITDTKSGWAQILTGYEPEVTGVFSNGRYRPIPRGYTVFERLEQHFGPDNIVTSAVIGKKGHVDADGPQRIPFKEFQKKKPAQKKKLLQAGGRVTGKNGAKCLEIPGKPYYYTKDGMDVFLNGLGTNENVGVKAMEFLEKYQDKRFFFFIHFPEIDHQGHKYGENSKEYNDALISSDLWTGRIIQKLRELKLYERTIIFITADHGFDEGMKTHQDAPYVFLAANDRRAVRRGSRCDIAPTILELFGLDLKKINPPLDGHPLTKPYEPPAW
ncbi:MAG: alkaline phosphatase family protein [Bacillota bacterium]